MNIRAFHIEDSDKLAELWYQNSIKAHHFINKDYWASQKQAMKEKYLPMADTYVITDQGGIQGFLSVVDETLAAIFVDVAQQGKGYGKQLLEFIKGKKDRLELKVYQKNQPSIDFYLKNGFELTGESLDEDTMEKEFILEWKK
ncbi:N-acetyltransferase [Gracilibacillus alcaliphilus]|uniref:N-acetyltransferase n=1 Tax=Gracilibacillus alcaliphilus TaxID=1401441 RepID=UPI00195EE46C|nr:N-acetyltransferase [Gracilibacillus alcaliphilus]MBM7675371.1 putative acetyltransferase [Gracilibacillus alcaliphilus]